MKNLLILLTVLTLAACNSSKTKSPETDSNEPMNQTIQGDEGILIVGKMNRQGLQSDGFKDWFAPQYEAYTPNPKVILELKPLIKDVDITAFMGTWCEDSHRDIPDLYRILDELNYNQSQLILYGVSEDKAEPAELVEKYDIIQVPTIIFYKNGEEIGRIVEYSIRTLEQDMLDILSGKNYKHPYSDF